MIGSANDMSLVQAALAGDTKAWDRLLACYERPIYNFALRTVGHHDDALDLVQETFLSVYRNLHRFSGKSSFKTWLYTIASRRTVDLFRRRKPTESLDDSDQPMDVHLSTDAARREESPVTALLRHETNRHLLRLLRQLSDEERMVVELKCFGEMTFDEMETALQISANTLKSRFYGALRKMKAMPEVAHVVS